MSEQWYYSVQNQKFGPVTAEQLMGLAASGQLGPNDLVWKQGLADWVPATQINGLKFSKSQPAPQPNPFETSRAAEASPVADQIPQFPEQRLYGNRSSVQTVGDAFASTAGNGVLALSVLGSNPIALTYYTLVWGVVSILSVTGLITIILYPMFAMGYLNVIRQHVAGEKVKLSAFISFMRHGAGALWHLFMLFAAFLVLMSMLISPVLVLGAVVAGFTGGMMSNPMSVSQSSAMLSMILVGVLMLSYLFALVSGMILFFYLLLEVSVREPEPDKEYHLVYDAFSQTLRVGATHWKEILLSGLLIACLSGLYVVLLTLVPQVFSQNVTFLLTALFTPLAAFAFFVYITVFVSMTCINLQKNTSRETA